MITTSRPLELLVCLVTKTTSLGGRRTHLVLLMIYINLHGTIFANKDKAITNYEIMSKASNEKGIAIAKIRSDHGVGFENHASGN